MSVHGAQQQITQALLAWEGVSAAPHRFGGTEYQFNTREIGHIHGDSMVDIPFPVKVRQRLVAEGRAQPHHLLPETGWISFYIQQPADVEQAIVLLQESYALARNQATRRTVA